MKEINKILIANRGEIACRIIKTAAKMGISTVAVYSRADRNAPFVTFSDEAACIGEGPSATSYLDIDKIVGVAKDMGADAIHPGYGFLSENPKFASAVEQAGLIFIGPTPDSIELMGSKLAAKEAVKKHGIPLIPGTDDPVEDPSEAMRIGTEIGFPVMIKAAAGGGGKGMRIVSSEKEMADQIDRAISEAQSAFGDGRVFLEKYIVDPKHIEVQVLADEHGKVIHLFERECSVQRRHQKVVEEAPSAFVTRELREKLGQTGAAVARAAQYRGAGTVEFIMDRDHNFYFLEMNTRLQVEHPVTEFITGLDLVEWQIRIARGEHISFEQEELQSRGHAIELRVYAEDPYDRFLPGTGNLERYRPPSGEGIRVDDGYKEGQEIPIYYDPLLSKLVVWGETRAKAIERMKRAILDYEVKGVTTTLPFGRFVMDAPVFRDGTYTTNFVDRYFYPSLKQERASDREKAIGMVGLKAFFDAMEQLKLPRSGSRHWFEKRR